MLASKIEKEKNCARENQRTDFKCDRDSGPDKKIKINQIIALFVGKHFFVASIFLH